MPHAKEWLNFKYTYLSCWNFKIPKPMPKVRRRCLVWLGFQYSHWTSVTLLQEELWTCWIFTRGNIGLFPGLNAGQYLMIWNQVFESRRSCMSCNVACGLEFPGDSIYNMMAGDCASHPTQKSHLHQATEVWDLQVWIETVDPYSNSKLFSKFSSAANVLWRRNNFLVGCMNTI